MHQDIMACDDTADASVVRGGAAGESLCIEGVYHIECVGPDGTVLWSDIAENVVPYQGRNAMLDIYLAAGTPPTTFYMSLITAGTATTASTYASPTVTETTSSIIALRVAIPSWSAAASGAKAAGTTALSIIGSATITGNMVVSGGSGITTVGNTAATGGVLLSAANFSGGSKVVSNGDTLNVTYSLTLS